MSKIVGAANEVDAPAIPEALRISYVSSTYIPSLSALSVVAMKTCQAMTQEGNSVELIARKHPSSPLASGQTLWSHYGVRDRFPVRVYASTDRVEGVDYDLRSMFRMWRRRPELVYTLNLRLAAAATSLRRSVIYEAHDVPSGKLGPWYFRRLLRSPNLRGVVAISDGMKSAIRDRFDLQSRQSRVVVAHDGVDMERFDDAPTIRDAKSKLGLDPNRFAVGYTGHLYAGRGVELIVALARRLSHVQFLMVGGHPESVAERRRDALQIGLSNIRYEGFVPNAALPLYQAACDALLMPYQQKVSFQEGRGDTSAVMSPGKMFEYLAAERLIISSDLPVIREVLNDANAVLCGPEDVDAWESAIRRAQSEPRWVASLARQARADAEKYTWRRRVRHVLGTLMAEPK